MFEFIKNLFGGQKAAKVPVAKKAVGKVAANGQVARPAAQRANGAPVAAGAGAPAAGAKSAQVVPLVRQAAAGDAEPIVDTIPPHNRVLTGGDANAIMKLPKELEYAIVAVETGMRRARLFYDPDAAQREVGEYLRQLRGKLAASGYEIDGAESRCRAHVLRALIDNHRSSTVNNSFDASKSVSTSKAFWDRVVEYAVRENATDIHVQIVRSNATIKIRVDGELEPIPGIGFCTASQAEQAVGWCYTNATIASSNSNSTFERNTNLYAMVQPQQIHGKQIALRYQSVKGEYGPKVVCRLLNTDVDAPTLSYEQLGYYPSQIEMFKETADLPSGMILFAGVTGSGKTTTQKTFIETHPGNGSSAFYSMEDPIEYPLRNVHQIPLQRDLLDKKGSAAKYAEAVAALMRSDPDGAMIGELRDEATVMAAMQIVETGHFAVGTIHAHLMSGIVPRMCNQEIGGDRQIITGPNILTLLNYQALVPKVCPECGIAGHDHQEFNRIHFSAEQEEDTERAKSIVDAGVTSINKMLGTLDRRFKLPREHFKFRRFGGCSHCNNRGTKGLTVVAEMFMPDRAWLTHVADGNDYTAIQHYRFYSNRQFESVDMTGKTVFEHTLHKSLSGIVDPRQCQRFDSFERFEILEML